MKTVVIISAGPPARLSGITEMLQPNAMVVWLLTVLAFSLTGCKSKTAPERVSGKTKSSSIESPQWIDVATAIPDVTAIRSDGRQVITQSPPLTHACELPSGKRLHTWPERIWAAYSGDGTTILTVSNSVASVLDSRTFRTRQTFPSPMPRNANVRPRFVAAISHDGSQIALADFSQASDDYSATVVRVYNCSTGAESFSVVISENAGVQSLDFLSNAKRLLVQYSGPGVSGKPGARQLWDIQRSRMVAEFAGTSKVIVSRNGQRFAVGKIGQKTEITVHDARNGELQNQFQRPDILHDFTFRPDSQQVLMASTTDKVFLGLKEGVSSHITQWSIANSKITFEQTHTEFPFKGAMYDAEGDRIFGALAKPTGLDDDVDYYLLGWNAKTSTQVKALSQAFFSYEYGNSFFVPNSDNVIHLNEPLSIRNVVTGEESSPVERYRTAQSQVQFKPNDHAIYTASMQADLQTGVSSPSWPVGPRTRFVQDGKTLFDFQHPSLSLIDSEGTQPFWNLHIKCASYAARDSTISSDARYIVRSQPTSDDSIEQSRVMIIRPEEPNSPTILHRYASTIAIHPEAQKFATASDQAIEEFEISTGEFSREIGDVPGRVLDMAYTADGSQIVACGVMDYRDPRARYPSSSLGWVWLYDSESQEVRKLKGHTAVVTSLALDSPRKRLATGSHDGTVRLWDTTTGECVWVYRGHHSQIYRVDISSDGKLLASAGVDGIATWNIAGVVDTALAPVKVAEKLTFTEPSSHAERMAQRQNVPQRPSPAQSKTSWDVVRVGETSRVHFHNRSVDLLLKENSRTAPATQVKTIPRRPNRMPHAIGGPSSKSRDGKRLLFTNFSDPVLKVFNSDFEELQSWPIRASERTAVISPDGNHVFVERSADVHRTGKIHIDQYDVQSGKLMKTICSIDARWGTNLKVDPQGQTLIVHFDNNSMDLREIATGKSLGKLLSPPAGAGRRSQYSPDGRLIALGKYPDNEIQLCDPLTLMPIQTITCDLPVRWFQFTPDAKRILVGQPYAESRTLLTMWEIDGSDATKVRRLWSYAGPVGDKGHFSDDGRRYLSPANWNMWTLWDTENGHVDVAIISSNSNSAGQFVLSADGESIRFYAPNGGRVWPEANGAQTQ